MAESQATIYTNLEMDQEARAISPQDKSEIELTSVKYVNTEIANEQLNQSARDREEIVYEIVPEPNLDPIAPHPQEVESPGDNDLPLSHVAVQSDASIFHRIIMTTLDLFTLQIIDNLITWAFPNARRVGCIVKRFFQMIQFLAFLILTVESLREFGSDYRQSGENYSSVLGHADTITVVLAVAFSLISVASLAFLYIFSDILSRSNVTFRKWTFKYFKETWVACIFVIIAYITISLGLFISVFWKAALNVAIFLFLSISPAGIVFLSLLFIIHSIAWHLAPLVLCFTVRSVSKQLQHETDEEMAKVKEHILGNLEIQEGIVISYYELMARMVKLASSVKYIATFNIVTVFSMVVIIFLTSFNDDEGILTTHQSVFQTGGLPKFAYLWLVFASYYLIIVIMLMTQSIAKLNSKLSKFSDLILQDKEVRLHLIKRRLENPQFVDEILRSLNFISNSKTRFKVAIFGDLTTGAFHALLIAGFSLLFPFILKLPVFLSNFTYLF